MVDLRDIENIRQKLLEAYKDSVDKVRYRYFF